MSAQTFKSIPPLAEGWKLLMGLFKQYLTSPYFLTPEFKRIKVSSLISTGPQTEIFHITAATVGPKGLATGKVPYWAQNVSSFNKLCCSENSPFDCHSEFHYFMQNSHGHSSYSWMSHRGLTVFTPFAYNCKSISGWFHKFILNHLSTDLNWKAET